jgi:hypothetical protein
MGFTESLFRRCWAKELTVIMNKRLKKNVFILYPALNDTKVDSSFAELNYKWLNAGNYRLKAFFMLVND